MPWCPRAVEVAGDDKCISESVFIFALTLKLDPHPARIFREVPPPKTLR
jgi:hypothetical protein